MPTVECKKHGTQPGYKHGTNKSGVVKYDCKACKLSYIKTWDAAHREKIKSKHKAYRAEWKLTVFRHYSKSDTPFCACCNESTFDFLTLDHTMGGGNAHRKELGGGGCRTYKWAIDNNFPDMFRVLCFNCNACYGMYGRCPHQDPKIDDVGVSAKG